MKKLYFKFFIKTLVVVAFSVSPRICLSQNPTNISDLVFFVESIAIDINLHVANCNTTACLSHPNSEQAPIEEQYCDATSCSDGCVRRWQDQSSYIPSGGFNPPEYTQGRNFGQDDSEKPCYIPNGINGKPSIQGGPPYGGFVQDKYLELKVSDIISLAQDFSIFLLCKPIDQSATGNWSYFGQATSRLQHNTSNNSLQMRIDGSTSIAQITNNNAVALDEWQLIEIHRDEFDILTTYIDLQDVTPGVITRSGTARIGYLLSNFKTTGNLAMYGEVATFIIYNRGLESSEIEDVRKYINEVYELGLCINTREFTAGSWDNGTPDINTSAIISDDYSTLSNGSIEACEITVTNGATLTIFPEDFLKTFGDITIESGANLVVEHQGSVVQKDPNATVNNNGTINVNITSPVLQTRDFMVMGSPMTAETRTDVFNSSFLVLQHTPADFIPHPLVPVGGTNFADDNNDFWNQFATGPIHVGEGYIVRPQSGYTDPANVAFNFTHSQGTLNNGDITKSVVFNGLGTNPDGTPNVYANPYASAISADDFITDNALVNEIYLWEHLTPPSDTIPGAHTINFSMGDISMYNLSGGTAAFNETGTSNTEPNGIISTGQGFGIKAFAAGTVTFTNSMRRTTGNTTLRNPERIVDRIWLTVSSHEYELRSTTLIGFNTQATDGLDSGFDSNRLATFFALYSHLEDGSEQLGIQTREGFNNGIKIRMGFASQLEEQSMYTISIDKIEGAQLSEATVYLIDNELNIITNLNQGDYNFVSGKGTFNSRFTLQFEYETLGTVDSSLDAISIYPNPSKDILNVASAVEVIDSIEVYDVHGRLIEEVRVKAQGVHQIDLSSMQATIYFVRVHTENGSITKTIIKN